MPAKAKVKRSSSRSGGGGGLKGIFTSPVTPVVIGLLLVLGVGIWATPKDSPAGDKTGQTEAATKTASTSQPSAGTPQGNPSPAKTAPAPSGGDPKAGAAAPSGEKAILAARSKIDRSAGAAKTMILTVYYSDGLTGGMSLQPVEMKVAQSVSRIKATVEQLLQPPQELKLHSNLPAGTRLLGANIKDGVAIVDLSPEAATVRGSEAVNSIMASLVYSLTAIDDVKSVQLWINGRPAMLDGLEWAKPISRDDMEARNLYTVEPVVKYAGP